MTGIDLVDATLIIGGVGLMVLWIIILFDALTRKRRPGEAGPVREETRRINT